MKDPRSLEYHRANQKKVAFTLLFVCLAVIAFFITLGFGVYKISVIDAVRVFVNHLTGSISNPRSDHYIWDIRVPRALGCIIVGGGLSVAGVIMQNNFRNPLAEPYTMGISSGAFLGVVLYMVSGISIIPFFLDEYALLVNAFIMSLIPMCIILLVSTFRKLTPTTMILTGIAVMFLFSSICQYLLVSAPSESLADAYSWRVGTLAKMSWAIIPYMAIPAIIFSVILWLMSSKLNVLYSGDRAASTLGESAPKLRMITLAMVSVLTASLVSFTGTVGFIGLVGPHVARIFVGSNNRYLIPSSAAFGAAFLLVADTIAKVTGANGLPVGVICSMFGGPLFIWILIKQRRSAWA